MKELEVKLLDGTVCSGDLFEEKDFLFLKEIFQEWLKINEKLKSLGGRNLNVPDVFSEALFCYFFNAVRTNGTAHSYDCVSIDSGRGVQVKSASIEYDCTSFGPTSTWDDLYYVDFAPNGNVDGNVFFYKIDVDFSGLILNAKKKETFRDQQLQGRRPRFSIKRQIIDANNLKPVLKINLAE